MITEVVSYIALGTLVFVAAVCKAICDTLNFHFSTSVFKNGGNWWNPSISWKDKYNWFPDSKILTWLFSNPLVLFTDAWHCFGMIERFCLFACMGFTPAIGLRWYLPVTIFAYLIFFDIAFDIFFTYILNRYEPQRN